MKKTVTCIIPFYNEKGRIDNVLSELIKVKNIDEIICVDDGSTDNYERELRKKFSNITILKLVKNLGKVSAVRKGVKKTKSEYVFLCDADIVGLNYKIVEKAINIIFENATIEMILLKGKFVFPNSLIARSELIFSGIRILNKKTLEKILNSNINSYQLEIAINDHMIKNNQTIYWVVTEILNIRKSRKYGFIKGLIGDLKMVGNVMNYGIMKYFFQILFFARKKITI